MNWNWVTLKKFADLSGYSEEAARQKIKKGQWLNRVHFKKAPDGRLLVNLVEIEKWIVNTQA